MGEHDVAVGSRHPALGRVDDDVPEDEAAVGRLVLAAQLLGSSELGADAREQLARTERLGDVIVGPDLQAEHYVYLVVLGAEDDHRHAIAGSTDLAADVETREIGEHQIEDDDVRMEDFEAGERLAGALRL